MRLAVGMLVAVLAAAGALSLPLAAPAPGATPPGTIVWAPCKDSNDFACGHIAVPLDPTGAYPGTISLALRRHRAPLGEAHEAIVALAGGPGQPALPFAEDFAELLGPIAARRDLIVFDQRGIGLSQPLACHAFENPRLYHSPGALVGACGDQLGPARRYYTSANTVADIEAIRAAGGYEKLVLYGTSYGTKVAEEYAATYPTHVAALVLDSVVPPAGPDPLNRATFAAVNRVLTQLCVRRLCAHITPHPVADLAKVVRRMHGGTLRGRIFDAHGHAHTVAIESSDLLDLLVASDFSPRTRAEFVPYVRAAADGDTAPLARLLLEAGSGGEEEGREDSDTPLYYATSCEEELFPWNRAVSPATRLAEARHAIAALGPAAPAPFTAADMLAFGPLEECAHWPFTTPAPTPVPTALPAVPTLILSGTNDLRTPTANASEVAAQIPGSHLLVVPYAGHAVLEDEPTLCARVALQALFANRPIQPCKPAPPPVILRPPPLPPLRLSQVPPAHGNRGKAGRTLQAVVLTLADFGRQLAYQLSAALSSPSLARLSSVGVGGLRAGWVRFNGREFVFHAYSYVPGVTLSGTVRSEKSELRIGGSAAAHGLLRLAGHGALTGTLGGQRVHATPSTHPSAAIVGSNARASHHLGAGGSAGVARARELSRILGRLFGA